MHRQRLWLGLNRILEEGVIEIQSYLHELFFIEIDVLMLLNILCQSNGYVFFVQSKHF